MKGGLNPDSNEQERERAHTPPPSHLAPIHQRHPPRLRTRREITAVYRPIRRPEPTHPTVRDLISPGTQNPEPPHN